MPDPLSTMVFVESLAALIISVGIVWILTRLPMVILPRFRINPDRLVAHPAAPAIDEHLVVAMLRLRRSYWMAIPFALVPLGYGLLMLRFLPSAIGFGLTVGGGWVLLSRLLPASLAPRRRTPYSMPLIHELNRIRLHSADCCVKIELLWQPDAVRCVACGAVHLSEARPDLGRKRSDGWLLGSLRLLLLDGRPATDHTTESELSAPTIEPDELPSFV